MCVEGIQQLKLHTATQAIYLYLNFRAMLTRSGSFRALGRPWARAWARVPGPGLALGPTRMECGYWGQYIYIYIYIYIYVHTYIYIYIYICLCMFVQEKGDTRMRTLKYMADAGWSRRRVVPHGGHQMSLNIAAGLQLGSGAKFH